MRTHPRPGSEHSAPQNNHVAQVPPPLPGSDRFVPVATALAILGMLLLIFMGRW